MNIELDVTPAKEYELEAVIGLKLRSEEDEKSFRAAVGSFDFYGDVTFHFLVREGLISNEAFRSLADPLVDCRVEREFICEALRADSHEEMLDIFELPVPYPCSEDDALRALVNVLAL